jgi:capsular polysaccharide biosynthesis protein
VARDRNAEEGAQLSEQTLDVGRVLWLMRRRRSVVAACILIGALVPTIVLFWRPTSYTSTSLVLVSTPASSGSSGGSSASSSTSNTNITDSAIAESSTVLTAAAARVAPHTTLQEAQKRVKATAVATNLVQITATGSSPRAAEALANAVANQLVGFVTSSDVSNGSSAIAGLEAQAAALTTQVNKYDQEIQLEQAAIHSSSTNPSLVESDTELLGSLTTAQSNASLQLQSVNSQIAAAKLNDAASNGGTEVIQSASSAAGPSLVSRLLPIVFGAILGLLVGGAYVVVRQRKTNLTTRDEIAAAAGVPVVLSSAVEHLTKSSDWLTMLREHEPSETELWNVRKVLSYLDVPEAGRRVLTVITLAGDTASMAAVAHFAVASAAMDVPTSLVLTSDDPGTRGLSDVCDLLTARNEAARKKLRLFKGSSSVDEAESTLTVISIVLNPDQPKLPTFVARGMVFLALSAGFLGEDQLARVLIAVGQEGLSVEGLFVTNPMSADRTLGSLSNTNERVTRFLQSRALQPWTGNADIR